MRSRIAHQAGTRTRGLEDEKQRVQYFWASGPAPEAPEVAELNVSGERICMVVMVVLAMAVAMVVLVVVVVVLVV